MAFREGKQLKLLICQQRVFSKLFSHLAVAHPLPFFKASSPADLAPNVAPDDLELSSLATTSANTPVSPASDAPPPPNPSLRCTSSACWAELSVQGLSASPEKGVLGLYGNIMGDCVIAVRPYSCQQAHHRAC